MSLNLTSCNNCGVVLDKRKRMPTLADSGGKIFSG